MQQFNNFSKKKKCNNLKHFFVTENDENEKKKSNFWNLVKNSTCLIRKNENDGKKFRENKLNLKKKKQNPKTKT